MTHAPHTARPRPRCSSRTRATPRRPTGSATRPPAPSSSGAGGGGSGLRVEPRRPRGTATRPRASVGEQGVWGSGSVKEPAYKTLIRTPHVQIKALSDPYRRVGLAEPLVWGVGVWGCGLDAGHGALQSPHTCPNRALHVPCRALKIKHANSNERALGSNLERRAASRTRPPSLPPSPPLPLIPSPTLPLTLSAGCGCAASPCAPSLPPPPPSARLPPSLTLCVCA
jgi:hypothetical protein